MISNKFDERQKVVRGEVFTVSFFVLIGLLFFNSYINMFGFHWASIAYQNMILLFAALVFANLLLIIRGVYFHMNQKGKYFLWVGIVFILYFLTQELVFHRVPLVGKEGLNITGFNLVVQLTLFIVWTSALASVYLNKWREKKAKKEENNYVINEKQM